MFVCDDGSVGRGRAAQTLASQCPLQIDALAHPQILKGSRFARVMSRWRPSADSHRKCYMWMHSDRSLDSRNSVAIQSSTYAKAWIYLIILYTHAALLQPPPSSIHISSTTNYRNYHNLAAPTSCNDDRSASSKKSLAQRDQISSLFAQRK